MCEATISSGADRRKRDWEHFFAGVFWGGIIFLELLYALVEGSSAQHDFFAFHVYPA